MKEIILKHFFGTCIILPLIKDDSKFAFLWDWYAHLFLHKELNVGWILVLQSTENLWYFLIVYTYLVS